MQKNNTPQSKHITDMLTRTINTHNGHTYHINNYNNLYTKPEKHLTIYTNITTKELQQLKTATITIRELLENIQTLFLANTDTQTITKHTTQELNNYLPEKDDYHHPFA